LDAPPTGRIRQFLDSTREVANLTKFGPINRQSTGVIELLHGQRTAVHVVTLLEEMPVQETVDAAAELARAGYSLGAIVVNRVRPTLIIDGQVAQDGRVDTKLLTAGLRKAGIPAAHVPALAQEMADYAEQQRLQAENRSRLTVLDQPLIELPELNPPVELGELAELAVCFTSAVPTAAPA
jgi:anion-transporting  ArsA/GET3 family ATPase